MADLPLPINFIFVFNPMGPLLKLSIILIDAFDEKYITEEKLNYYKIKAKEIERMLKGYINFLRT